MPVLRKTVRTFSGFLPAEWKRRVKTTLFEAPDTEASLRRMRALGFNPAVAIDVGAYVGEWTTGFRRIFSGARVLMVEPQPSHIHRLRSMTAACAEIELAPVLLGACPQGSVAFYLSESASSVLPEPERRQSVEVISIPMTTLDEVTAGSKFARPDFIKLDVQGYELEVLKGGEKILRSAQAVLMEVNLLPILDGAPLFHEAVHFMGERGFRLYDLCTFFRRPYDGALWQVDAIFVRSSSPLVASRRWA